MQAGQYAPSIQTRGMSTQQMFDCLVEHGCPDLTPSIDPNQYSSGMVAAGGFGDIWKGRFYDGKELAIKVWRFTSMTEGSEKSIKRGMREIYNWSTMNHENIHKLLGVIMFQGRLGMVSQWMEHGNLRQYVRKNEDVNRYQLCTQIANAVQYLHDNNMVHGDIKASNILVSQAGIAKLTDFDFSIMANCNLFTETTRIGGGTLRWMAPELVLETSYQRSKRTDIYALGMTFLEVITGDIPYSPQCGNDPQVLYKLIQKTFPERTEHFNEDEAGNRMWELLVQCWDYDSAARPAAKDVRNQVHLIDGLRKTPFEHLIEHGCSDLNILIDPNHFSSGAITGGGFHDIWKGRLRDGRNVAVKLWRFSSVMEDSKKNVKRVTRETYNWSKMDHENIHKLLGVIMFQGRLGLVSQWMENGNLREYIQKNEGVDRYQLCIQVANGMQYLHDQNTVHGDLKAKSVLVSPEGIPMLTGFDYSISSDGSLFFSETSQIGGGTLRWMAPELVIEPSYQRDKCTDVYALGMTFLEIITGNVPYFRQCPSDSLVLLKLLRKEFPSRTEHFGNNERGSRMWELLKRCWDYDPAARPTTDEVLRTLQALVNETEPTTA